MQLETGRITEEQFDAQEEALAGPVGRHRQSSGRRGRVRDPGTGDTEAGGWQFLSAREDRVSQRMPAFFDQQCLQLLLFGGKGGVGKDHLRHGGRLRMSALATSRSFLLVSTDPAHSGGQPGRVRASRQSRSAGVRPPTIHRSNFRERNGPHAAEIGRPAGTFLDDEDIHPFLSLALPGLDELMAFFEIASWGRPAATTCIVVWIPRPAATPCASWPCPK